MSALFANSQGLFLVDVLLVKRGALQADEKRLHALLKAAYGWKLPPQAVHYVKRAAELLAEVSDAELEYGIVYEAAIYDYNRVPAIIKLQTLLALSGVDKITEAGRERLNKAAALLERNTPSRRTRELLKALLKDDDDDESEDNDEDDEGDESGEGDEDSEDGDSESDGDDSDFDEKHPRWPAGSPDSTGGEFRSKDGGGTASSSPNNEPSSISQSSGQPIDPRPDLPANNDTAEADYSIEEAVIGSGIGSEARAIISGVKDLLEGEGNNTATPVADVSNQATTDTAGSVVNQNPSGNTPTDPEENTPSIPTNDNNTATDAENEENALVTTESSADAMNAEQAANLSRFESKLPANAQETQIMTLPNGNVIFQADVPSNNIPGSFARYEKTVDASGNTVGYTKTTYAPDGTIVNIKNKFGN